MQLQSSSFNEIGSVRSVHGIPLIAFFEKYLDHFERPGSNTHKAKSIDFGHLLLFLGEGDIDQPRLSDFTKGNVEAFLACHESDGYAYATLNRRLSTFKHFSRVLSERLEAFHDDVQFTRYFDLPRHVSKALKPEEVERIRDIARIGMTEIQCVRNKLVIELLHGTGIRTDELCSLNLRHLQGRYLKGFKAKGRKVRDAYVPISLDPLIAEYLNHREQTLLERVDGYAGLPAAEKERLPLFITFYRADINEPDSLRMSTETLRNIHEMIGKAAGVQDLHPHRWKHTLITDLDKQGVRTPVIMRIAGHSHASTTDRYRAAAEDEIIDTIEGRTVK